MSFYKTVLSSLFLVTLLEGGLEETRAENSAGLSTEINTLSFDSKTSSSQSSKTDTSTASVSAEDALVLLKEGNRTYSSVTFKNRVASFEKNKTSVSQSQNPHSIILSCSDSRVPPTLIFNQGLGDLFVVRDAGEVPGISVLASIEYAVKHLGVQLIVVMGHTDCGAIKAALSASSDKASESPNIEAMITEIRDNLGYATLQSASPHLKKEAFMNAKEVAKDLIKRSHIIRKYLQKGKLQIIPAIYDLKNGTVEFGEVERTNEHQQACQST